MHSLPSSAHVLPLSGPRLDRASIAELERAVAAASEGHPSLPIIVDGSRWRSVTAEGLAALITMTTRRKAEDWMALVLGSPALFRASVIASVAASVVVCASIESAQRTYEQWRRVCGQ